MFPDEKIGPEKDDNAQMRAEERIKIPHSVIVSEEVAFKGIICLTSGRNIWWHPQSLLYFHNFSVLIVHVDSDHCFITQTQRTQIGEARQILLAITKLFEIQSKVGIKCFYGGWLKSQQKVISSQDTTEDLFVL